MKNEKQELCPSDSCITAYGGVLALPPKVFLHVARRAQIPLIIYHLSFFIYNWLFHPNLLQVLVRHTPSPSCIRMAGPPLSRGEF